MTNLFSFFFQIETGVGAKRGEVGGCGVIGGRREADTPMDVEWSPSDRIPSSLFCLFVVCTKCLWFRPFVCLLFLFPGALNVCLGFRPLFAVCFPWCTICLSRVQTFICCLCSLAQLSV